MHMEGDIPYYAPALLFVLLYYHISLSCNSLLNLGKCSFLSHSMDH